MKLTRDELLQHIEDMWNGIDKTPARVLVPDGRWMRWDWIRSGQLKYTHSEQVDDPKLFIIKDIKGYVFSVFMAVFLHPELTYETLEEES